MATTYNPFDEIFSRLDKIEGILTNLCDDKFSIKRKNDTDKWFDLKGLIEYLPSKPRPQTVYDWVHKKIIPYHKSGQTKALQFLQSEIDQWIKSGRRKTQAEKTALAIDYLNKRQKFKL